MLEPLIAVTHRLGTCPIRFESPAETWGRVPFDAYVITDRNVLAAWGDSIPKTARVRAVEPGEASKSIAEYEASLRWLVDQGADRKSTLVAFGGGVVGDLAGFVAATYMRGIAYFQVPTTLLAQVDSSVGGKVAVDLPEGKNLVGSFYPPYEVAVGTDYLETLPSREFVNGMAEVWKYGYILDPGLVEALRRQAWTSKSPGLEEVIRRCIAHKARIVQEDEMDLNGMRAILNFGHTVGHALEKICGYEGILHGEAVAIGMVAEARIGEHLGLTETGTADRIAADLAAQGLPIAHERLSDPQAIAAMGADKKTEGGRLAMSLLTRIGECKLVRDVPAPAVRAVLCGT